MSQENQAVSLKPFQVCTFLLSPSDEQSDRMLTFVDACRYTHNQALARNLEKGVTNPSEFTGSGLVRLLPVWKQEPERDWIRGAPAQALLRAVKDADAAYFKFISGKAPAPSFRVKGQFDKFTYPKGFQIDHENHCIFMPKLGLVRHRNNRPLFGVAKRVTVSRKKGGWFASVLTES